MLVTLTVKALTPLAFARTKPGRQFRDSLPYVPGGAVFGAIGRLLAEREQFDAACMRALICHNAYPTLGSDTWSRPLPATALKPKGASDASPFDTLIPQLCGEQQKPAALLFTKGDTETADGFYTFQDDTVVEREVTQRVLTRVAINRRRGTAEDQRLYSPLVLNETMWNQQTKRLEQTLFRGSVVVPEGFAAIDETILGDVTHLGGRQSSGLGNVELSYQATAPETGEMIAERVTALNTAISKLVQRYHRLRPQKDWTNDQRPVFTINLLADAVLMERGWLPTNEFSAAELLKRTGIRAELLRSITNTRTLSGWNVLWQRPKPTQLATTMGSLFVFQAQQPLTPKDYQALARLQHEGIGERRQEGYGQIRICDEFHYVAKEGA